LVSLESAAQQVLVTNAAHTSMPEIVNFPDVIVSGENGKREYTVPNLESDLRACHDQGKLPSEIGIKWAKPGKLVDVTKFVEFPQAQMQFR
jgi:hypothetical protein